MRPHLVATAALLLALTAPATAQEQPPTGDPAQNAPDPKPTEGSTGGTTAQGREHLPDDTTKAPIAPQTLDATASPEAGAAGHSSRVVSDEMVKELHQMGLEQQKRSATPPPAKSEEAKAAAQKAIAAHRETFFASIEERK